VRGNTAAADIAAALVSTRRRENSLVTSHSLLGFCLQASVGNARDDGKPTSRRSGL
jgi:hypothetical protein